jgi:ring-1,2-phenylacetyl-CoA epoxidase subunit PaaE
MSDLRNFHELRVARVRPEAGGSIAVTLAVPPALVSLFSFQPGQYLNVKAVIGNEEVRRSYSICSSRQQLDTSGEIEIGIRAVAGGQFSNWAVQYLTAGSSLSVMPPQGRFVVQQANAKHRAGFAAGSGITPVLSIMASCLQQETDSHFTLIYGNRNMASVMFNEALQDLKDTYTERVTLVHVLSKQAQEIELLQGRLDVGKVTALLNSVLTADSLDEVFVCGPQAMMDDTCRALMQAGVPAERIHSERFLTDQQTHRVPLAISKEPTDDSATVALTLVLDGKQHQLRMSTDQKILDVGLAAGLDLPYSCRGGVCCTCRAKVMEGSVVMDKNFTLETWETQQGFVLSCQSRPTSLAVTVSYDER